MKFLVNGQRLAFHGDNITIPLDEELTFEFSDEWNQCSKRVNIWNRAAAFFTPLSADSTMILPQELSEGAWKMNIVGHNDSELVRASSSTVTLRIRGSV